MKSLRWIAPVTFLLAIAVAIMLVISKPRANTVTSTEPVRLINTVTIQPDVHSPSLPLFVRVSTPNHTRLRSAVTADIKEIIALDGDRVSKGETLLLLDDREARLTVRQRRADIQDSQSQIDAENLDHKNEMFVIQNDDGEDARRNREQIIERHKIRLRGLESQKLRAEVALELAELDLQRTVITAPFDGQVTQLHVSVGDRVSPGDRLIDVYDRRSMELIGPIPRRYQATLQQALDNGEPLAAVSVDSDTIIQAELVRLGGEVNERSGGINAIFSITQGGESLSLGRSLRVQLQLPAVANSFVLSNTALYGADTIYRVVDGRLQAVRVSRLGDYIDKEQPGGSLLLSEEVRAGDVIMTTQLPNASENLPVKISNPY